MYLNQSESAHRPAEPQRSPGCSNKRSTQGQSSISPKCTAILPHASQSEIQKTSRGDDRAGDGSKLLVLDRTRTSDTAQGRNNRAHRQRPRREGDLERRLDSTACSTGTDGHCKRNRVVAKLEATSHDPRTQKTRERSTGTEDNAT